MEVWYGGDVGGRSHTDVVTRSARDRHGDVCTGCSAEARRLRGPGGGRDGMVLGSSRIWAGAMMGGFWHLSSMRQRRRRTLGLGARLGQAQGHSLAITAASPTGGDEARECGAEEGMSGDPRRRAWFASVRV